MSTYSLIGKAYALVEAKEPWVNNAQNIADIAVMSAEALTGDRNVKADCGANRLLLENKYLYNFVDEEADLSGYKLLILPDVKVQSEKLIEKIKAFVKAGGKVIASGEALVKNGEFILDTGAKYIGENEFYPTYLVPAYDTVNGKTEYVMRCNSYLFEAVDCDTPAFVQNPYFNRTSEHFCSHMHAPNNPEKTYPAVAIKGNIAYIGWDIFTAYATHGHLCFKELFSFVVNRMLGDERTAFAQIPDRAVLTLTRQEEEKRRIMHLLFAHTTLRGENTEVIEDTVPLYNVRCKIRCNKKPSGISLVPCEKELEFEYNNGYAEFIVPEVNIHSMIAIKD